MGAVEQRALWPESIASRYAFEMDSSVVNSNGRQALDMAREGMRRAQEQLDRSSDAIAKGQLSAEPMVDMIESKHLYAANAKVVQAQDDMLGTLLNVKR